MNSGDATPPPYPSGYALSPPPVQRARGGRVAVTALLVGALAGGAAGFGGAALLHETTSHNAAALSRSANAGLAIAPDRSGSTGAQGSDISTVNVAADVLPSVVKIYASSQSASGSGSGIVLTRSGEIVTNNHVVELALGGGQLAVSFTDGRTVAATIVGRDPLTDLAVIKAAGVSNARPATLGHSSDLRVGQPVVAVGAPYGLESTVTSGIVSALNRPVTTQGELADDPQTVFPAIQTDAAINPGNSGGPLVNAAGQVVGINSAIQTASSQQGGAQGGSIGLGFAIPIDEAVPIVEQLSKHQPATHARIGVSVVDATGTLGLPDGALVKSVTAHTPAVGAGLHAGDVISKVNGTEISDADSLVATVRSYRPGDRVTLAVRSGSGPQRNVVVTLGSD